MNKLLIAIAISLALLISPVHADDASLWHYGDKDNLSGVICTNKYDLYSVLMYAVRAEYNQISLGQFISGLEKSFPNCKWVTRVTATYLGTIPTSRILTLDAQHQYAFTQWKLENSNQLYFGYNDITTIFIGDSI